MRHTEPRKRGSKEIYDLRGHRALSICSARKHGNPWNASNARRVPLMTRALCRVLASRFNRSAPYEDPSGHTDKRLRDPPTGAPVFCGSTYAGGLRRQVGGRSEDGDERRAWKPSPRPGGPVGHDSQQQVLVRCVFISPWPGVHVRVARHAQPVGAPEPMTLRRSWTGCGATQLKTTPPTVPGGWRCYITNVIKEADVVRDFVARDKQSLAIEWADVLKWEIEQVSPTTSTAVACTSCNS